jgi:N-acetyl-anhydromuramyl-L-alanine amidase AmpD
MKLGSTGPEVRVWQEALVARGAQLAVDGVFGQRTHNATLAWQAAHGLPTTGEVGQGELQAVATPQSTTLRPPPMLAHSIPFVASRFQLRVPRAAVELVVLHCMEAAETSTTAEACAQYMATLPESAGKKSAHYYVDSDSVVQGVLDHHIAYHAPGCNHNGIGIEHAGFARQTREEWLDAYGQRMLGLSVQLSARLCALWHIPATFVRAADLQLRKPGITTHREVTAAFGKSTHTDPGPNFPITWYVERVAALMTAQGTV